MSIINSEYFKGSINIEYSNESISEYLELYIDEIEKKYLKKLLGPELYAIYIANKTNSVWASLVNGNSSAIEINGKNVIFEGLKQMLADFTFYHFVYDSQTSNSSVGEIELEVQNATNKIPYRKLFNAYNEAVSYYYKAVEYMQYGPDSDSFVLLDYEKLDTLNSFGI